MTLLDTATAAAALGITERTVRRLVARGKLTNHGTAGSIRIRLEEVIPEEVLANLRASRSVSDRV